MLTRHYDLGAELAALGIDVTIFASSFNHYSHREERLSGCHLYRVETHGSVRFVWIRTTPYDDNGLRRAINMLSFFLVVSVVQLRFDRPDAILGSSVHPFAGLAAWLIGHVRRAPFYFEVRDLWPQTLIDLGAIRADSPQARALRRLETFLYRRARRVLTVLPTAATYIAARGVPLDRISYLPNGVRLDDPTVGGRPVSRPAQAALELFDAWRSQGCVSAVYAGAHGDLNRLDVVLRAAAWIEAMPDAPPIRIALVGDGAEKPRLKALAESLALRTVAFLDPVPKSEISSILRAADVGIVSLADLKVFQYGLSPNKLMDYFAAERPVVLAAPTHDDQVSAAGAGRRVPAEDPERLAGALCDLAALSPEERRRMGERGRAYAAAHHDIHDLGRRLAEFLELAA